MPIFKDLITKENILLRVSESEIFRHFLGFAPNKHQLRKSLFYSPFRDEKSPSCAFYMSGNRLLFVDFGGPFHGKKSVDCFALVQFMYNTDFHGALCLINKEMQLGLGFNTNKDAAINFNKRAFSDLPKGTKTEETKITVETVKASKKDVEFWSSYHITGSTLNLYRVNAIRAFQINNKEPWIVRSDELAFSFFFKPHVFKIYQPYSKYKWIGNASGILQGEKQLEHQKRSDIFVITKGLKDVMVFYELGINAVAPQSEVLTEFPEGFIENIKNIYGKENIYINFDNDETGIKYMYMLASKFDIGVMYSHYEEYKDFSDVAKYISLEKVKELINENRKKRR
jgi:hypothetical protein